MTCDIKPGSAKAFLIACRPSTLIVGLTPIIVGTSIAYYEQSIAWIATFITLIGALAIQIGTNFINDFADFEHGADTQDRLGSLRTAQAKLLSVKQLKTATVVVFIIAVLCGLYLINKAGMPILIIGIASMLAGWAYTAGPYPLGYHKLGDPFVFVFFGFVAVCGTHYVQIQQLSPLALWAAIPIGCLATSILIINNLRDRITDKAAGKKTLAVYLGHRNICIELVILILTAYVIPVVLKFQYSLNIFILLPLLSYPKAHVMIATLWNQKPSKAMNQQLRAAAKLLLLYGVLLALGFVINK